MTTNKLWAPWRVKYITKIDKTKGCVFCKIQKNASGDKKHFVFARSRHSYAVLNIYPYNNGHCLILPNRHVGDLKRLTRAEREDLMDLLEHTQELLGEVLSPAGYNVGMNLGRVAGAGIPGHLHIHVVPRWRGDVNFMPVVGFTKVISMSLKVLFEKLWLANQKRRGRRKSGDR
ncbi:MAG: HIT domain-containing protein [Candidatus Omnitrophota bacterium]|nr:HIT domain-containing protein [Candidatus Omnitrophota bacterium]MDZ4242328.1 HIT domain-containing protein [Candidatus Omnitrophota bacterium]